MTRRAKIDRLDIPNEEQLRRLYKLAIEYRDLQPWTWMDDTDHFSIIDPDSHDHYFVVILSGSDHDSTLACLRSERGYQIFLDLMDVDPDLQYFDTVARMEAYYLTLEEKAALENRDIVELKRLGVSGKGRFGWPLFRNLQKGKLPARLTGTDCRIMTTLLEQTLQVCRRAQADKDFLYPPRRRGRRTRNERPVFLTRVQTVTQNTSHEESAVWIDEYWPVEPVIENRLVVSLGEQQKIDQLVALPQDENKVVEVDANYLPVNIEEPRGPGLHPLLFSAIDDEEGVVASQISQSFDSQVHAFIDQLMNHFLEAGSRPVQIVTCKDEVTAVLSNICQTLHIELVQLDWLEETDDLLDTIQDDLLDGSLPEDDIDDD